MTHTIQGGTLRAAYADFSDAALERALHEVADGARPGADLEGTDVLDHRLAEARATLHAAHDDSAFTALCLNLRAEGPERELLALLVGCETDVVRTARLARLTGTGRPGRLTLGAAARLLGGVAACVAAAGPTSALRRSGLVDVVETGPWATSELVLAPVVVWALGGDVSPDPELPVGTWMMEAPADGDPADPDTLVLVARGDAVRRRSLVARRRAADTYLVSPTPADATGWTALVREASITGSGVLVELSGELPPEGRQWIDRARHLAWAISTAEELPLTQLPSRDRVELAGQDDVVSAEEWRASLGGTPTHRLTAQQLEQVAAAMPAVGGDVQLAVRRLLAGPLTTLARRIQPAKTWDDLVLSEPRLAQLRTVVGRFRHARTVYDDWGVTTASGRGILTLFTGPSGTGKSLAAEVIAHTLGLDLYKIDLSSIVSKYIGETEQNLERLFQAASAGSAVLFFDEADSIFGKRSEVKDGRDRYANLEVSYLLQRLESYDGVVVLASNLPGNIDEAFLRRIHEVVSFTAPGVVERRAIWAHHLSDGALPVADLDVDRLAERFEVTGGIIRNAVVGAAFRAADDDRPLTMHHLRLALAGEYLKLGRMLNSEDFDV